MENKNKFWKGVLVGALVTAFSGLIIVGMSAGIYLVGRTVIENQAQAQAVESGDAANQSSRLDMKKIEAKAGLIQQVIDRFYLFDEDTEKVEDGIYMGLMYGLEDPYSVYYNAEDFQKLQEDTSGEYCGIGVMISQNRTTGIITVVKVFKGTPGFEAGLQPGDMIYKVGDEEVTGMDLDLLVKNYIKGEEGTPVTITVLRPENNEYVDFTMDRRSIEVPTVEFRMMENQTGYISVSQFDTITVEQFKSAIDSLEEQGMKKLVVDLRSNPGGVLDSVVSMLDYILPDHLALDDKGNVSEDSSQQTLLVYTADKNGEGDSYKCEDGHSLEIPMVVLINGDSASASEVFAGAVKDYRKATLMGTTTFGKGIVQNVIPLGDGTAIKLTTAHYFTPIGFDLHGKGLEPDVEVELKEELKTKAVVEPEEDNQLQEAVEYLNK